MWRKYVSSPEYKKDIKEIRALKGPDGKPFLSLSGVKMLLSEMVVYGENMRAKIAAVLKNPEEFARISKFKNRAMGVSDSIARPLPSTKKANPTLWEI